MCVHMCVCVYVCEIYKRNKDIPVVLFDLVLFSDSFDIKSSTTEKLFL